MLGKQLIEGSAEERPFHGSAETKLADTWPRKLVYMTVLGHSTSKKILLSLPQKVCMPSPCRMLA